MPKKSDHNDGIEYFVEGKPTSLEEIAKCGGRETWRSYLEARNLHRGESGDLYLKEKLGDYRSAHYLHAKVGIKLQLLEKLRKRGTIKAEKLKGRWYYSVQSLGEALKTVIK